MRSCSTTSSLFSHQNPSFVSGACASHGTLSYATLHSFTFAHPSTTSSSSHPNHKASVVGSSQPHVFSTTPFHPNNNIITTPPPRASLLFTLPNLNFSETRVQCVNGLLCFHPTSNVWFSSHVNAFTLIANPTTRQVVTLPLDHSINKEFLVSTHFGHDPVRDEFKVLRLVKYHGSHEFKIFTLGGDPSWRVVAPEKSVVLMHCLLSRHKRGLCVNGAIHWTYSSASFINSSLSIVAFDVGTEQFRVMPAPSGYSYKEGNVGHLKYPDLVEIGGCLCLVGYSGSDLKLWTLRDYQAQLWEHKNVVIPSGLVSQVVFPLCRVLTGEILLLPYFLPRRVKGVYYDMDIMSSRSDVIMEMPQPLWPDERSGEVDIFFCEESFRFRPGWNILAKPVFGVNGLLRFHPNRNVWFSSHVNTFTLPLDMVVTLPLDHSMDKRFMVSTHFGYDLNARNVVVMEMPFPLWPDDKSGEIDVVFCEESFSLEFLQCLSQLNSEFCKASWLEVNFENGYVFFYGFHKLNKNFPNL
ncbi:putative F-box protein [Spatholobus suberectus]|nr:putative F-box protein [Spatholobus suberectus]